MLDCSSSSSSSSSSSRWKVSLCHSLTKCGDTSLAACSRHLIIYHLGSGGGPWHMHRCVQTRACARTVYVVRESAKLLREVSTVHFSSGLCDAWAPRDQGRNKARVRAPCVVLYSPELPQQQPPSSSSSSAPDTLLLLGETLGTADSVSTKIYWPLYGSATLISPNNHSHAPLAPKNWFVFMVI